MTAPDDAFWSHVAARLARLAEAERAAHQAVAPFILDHLAVCEHAGSICGNPPPERGAELVAAYSRMIVRHHRTPRATDALHPGRHQSPTR